MIGPIGLVGSLLNFEGDQSVVTAPKYPGSAAIYPRGATPTAPSGPMIELFAYRDRTQDYIAKIYAADRTTGIALDPNDRARVKIGDGFGEPEIELESGVAASGGSTITIDSRTAPATMTIRLAESDLSNLRPGPHELELIIVDSSESNPSNAMKTVQLAVLHVLGVMVGETGL